MSAAPAGEPASQDGSTEYSFEQKVGFNLHYDMFNFRSQSLDVAL